MKRWMEKIGDIIFVVVRSIQMPFILLPRPEDAKTKEEMLREIKEELQRRQSKEQE